MASSSLGYPFAVPASSKKGGLLRTTVSALFTTLETVIAFPWQLTLRWISWIAAWILHALTSLGATPKGFIAASKLKELDSIVNHMHSREDLYRRAIRELQDELESKDSDRRKAIRKLKSNKEEIAQLTDQLMELQRAYNEGMAQHGADSRLEPSSFSDARQSSVLVHATFAVVAAALWWFSQGNHAALHWKLVFTLFFPVRVSQLPGSIYSTTISVLICNG